MRSYWHSCLTIAMVAGMISPAFAQFGSNQNEIGSYQSILSRAGYGSSTYANKAIQPPSITRQDEALPTDAVPVAPPADPAPVDVTNMPVSEVAPQYTEGEVVYGDCGTDDCGSYDRGVTNRGNRNANTVIGVNGLFFDRSYEDNRLFSFTPAGDYLFSNDADNDTLGGFEVSVTRRNSNGRGLDVRYWGLFSEQAVATLGPAPVLTNITGLADLDLGGTDVETIFDTADSHFINRDSDIHNLEINFLRNGGTYQTWRGRSASYEMLTGFRWFQFDEDFQYGADASVAPVQTLYSLCTENTLLGAQFGTHTERCVTDRMRLEAGFKVGVFNNRAHACQNVQDNLGTFATIATGPSAGQDFFFEGEKDDVSVLGEFNVGLIYQFNDKGRFNIGYRGLGISGIALAVDQIPTSFIDSDELNRVSSNGDLQLHGGYAGFQFSY